MQPFTTLEGVAAPIDEANVDTNQLCPTRFNKVPRGPKYAEILFYDQRNDTDGKRTDFLLNRPPYDKAQLIVGDSNFGCGSSRETAVYALYEFGIRCVIAPSFGDIFDAADESSMPRFIGTSRDGWRGGGLRRLRSRAGIPGCGRCRRSR